VSQPTTGQGDSPVNVPFGAVLQKLHAQYGKLIEQLMQENAEATAGLEAILPELQYLRSVVGAQQEGVQGLSALGGPLGGPVPQPAPATDLPIGTSSPALDDVAERSIIEAP
jgi:hypothetical protein